MQQSRQDSFLDREDDLAVPTGGGEGAGDDDDDLFFDVSDEFAPLQSDAERFWGPSAAPEVVVTSLEAAVTPIAEALLQGQHPDLMLQPLPQWILRRAQELQAASAPENVAPQPLLPPSPSTVLSLSDSERSSARTSRLLLVLDIVHWALSTARTVTVRYVWYRLKSAGVARLWCQASRAIDDAQMLLALPREALGLRAAPTGAVAGCLWIDDEDLSRVRPSGFSLPGSPAAARALSVLSDAAFLIVVEKYSVFQRLAEDKVWDHIPGGAVLVTARGLPDLATRAFCSHLLLSPSQSSAPASRSSSASASNTPPPPMQVLGLCDWNPGGVKVLTVYKHGSFAAAAAANAVASPPVNHTARASMEGVAYALRSMRWIGAHSSWFRRAQTGDEALHPLTDWDRSTARSMAGVFSDDGLLSSHPWVQQLAVMTTDGKAELEDCDVGTGPGTLSAVVAEAVNKRDWI